ncbi:MULTISPECIES: CBS domain-containing protein [unclassified Candidatus Frackibacter]|uniref:CBS domain-containing protein n=1 Tax=unclassified Candidatus Frackibacter TaxID=2648818 RepID=UPI000890BA1C|nr:MULTISPECIES: CBS domain-containing protein [unclassified Candidatus Frackibacter]SDC23423.1 CBS domain-containing protein [Candidatus Frackibacter sp. WG11]SEM48543.1 CBS domain-containing protein [Candidatus Frackibacter sp. WG12]SFL50369.1 CBS domain-containing protein [Candidatus Frackibacter sp. WG13]
MLAKDVMTKDVITVNEEATIKEVAKLLTKHKISGLPVVNDEQELVGVVTEQDLIVRDKKLHFPDYIYLLDSIIYLESFREFEEEFKKMIGTKVGDVMSEDVIAVDTETSTEEIATMMTENEINRVPVLEKDELVGIVSRNDLVSSLVK